MAGYSGTTLATKLGVKEDTALALLYAPDGWLCALPPHVTVRRRVGGRADVVLAFFTSTAKLEQRLDALGSMVFPAGGLWIAWPKKASRMETDLSDNAVRTAGLSRGMVDNKVCAVDEIWSAVIAGGLVKRGTIFPCESGAASPLSMSRDSRP
jgi:hypothetical protein